MASLERLIREIHRRSLWQVVAIYLAGAWVAMQVVREITLTLGLPGWFPPLAFSLLVVGFPLVVATAFVQEGGPTAAGDPAGPLFDGAGHEIRRAGPPRRRGDPVRRLFTWRNVLLAGGAAFALWGVVAAGWVVARGGPGEALRGSPVDRESSKAALAVLPFDNLSASEENEHFARGIHEAILTNLARVSELTVLSRTSVMRYANARKDMRTIGRELGATAVVEGSVQRSGDRIRVTAQLVDARSDAHLWAESYDRTLQDVFAVQSEVAERVADALEATLTPAEQRRIERRPTTSLTAYDLYLRGRQAYDRLTPEGNDEAVRLYREAIASDSSFALAWAGLANAYGIRVINYAWPTSWADTAVATARRAVALEPELDEAHKALALAYAARGRLRRSLEENLRAVELNPNHAGAVNNSGIIHGALGRLDEYLTWTLRARQLMPGSSVVASNMIWAHVRLGDLDAAAQWLEDAEARHPDDAHILRAASGLAVASGRPERALAPARRRTELHPDDASAWHDGARWALMAREYEAAAGMARRALELNPEGTILDHKPPRSILGYALLRLGQAEAGREALRASLERAERELDRGVEYPQLAWEMGAARAALGERDEALAWLERGYEAGYRLLFETARHDPMLDSLRDDPRFRRIMAEMEADVRRMRERSRRTEPG